MHVEEVVECKVTWPKEKERKANWELSKPFNAGLKEAIEKCLRTGEEVIYEDYLHLCAIKPRFPWIESAMEEPENKSLLKVTLTVYDRRFSCRVRP